VPRPAVSRTSSDSLPRSPRPWGASRAPACPCRPASRPDGPSPAPSLTAPRPGRSPDLTSYGTLESPGALPSEPPFKLGVRRADDGGRGLGPAAHPAARVGPRGTPASTPTTSDPRSPLESPMPSQSRRRRRAQRLRRNHPLTAHPASQVTRSMLAASDRAAFDRAASTAPPCPCCGVRLVVLVDGLPPLPYGGSVRSGEEALAL
jgi:hypothetical protein